jgi:hypothetical protein
MLGRVAQVVIVAVAVALLGSAARASASEGVTYTGTRMHVSAGAVVDFRALARHERGGDDFNRACDRYRRPCRRRFHS